MKRTLTVTFVVVAALALILRAQTPKARAFTVVETSIPDLRDAMVKGRVTSREIVAQYLMRIALYEHTLHAAIAINPRALEEADERDRERAAGRSPGPLRGRPVALKDNIHTTNMPTTGRPLGFAPYTAADE